MNRIARRTGIVLLFALLLLGGTCFFVWEYVTQGPRWVVFPGNPHVYSGSNIDCGQIVDSDGTMLLDLTNGREYMDDTEIIETMVHWLGDRDGYVSAPAIPAHASELVGYSLRNGLYSYSGELGAAATLTLNAELQKSAAEALEGYHGTVGVYNYKTGELLCAVSAPGFDPDNPPELTEENEKAYDGIYVNRFTQSLYTPGSTFKIITTAAVIDSIPDWQELLFTCEEEYEINGEWVTCEAWHGTQDLEDAMRNSCNCAYAQMVELLGPETLEKYVRQLGVLNPVEFDGIATAEGSCDISHAEGIDLAWAGIGQYTDLVNPCGFLQMLGAIANGGKGAVPYVVREIGSGNSITYKAETTYTRQILSRESCEALWELMENNVVNGYGSWNFPDFTVCAKSGTSQRDGETEPDALLAGFVKDDDYPLAFFLVVEEGGYGGSTCPPIMGRILEACKGYMDS